MLTWLSVWSEVHMFQLMPLPLTVSCFSKIQIGFAFLVPAHLGSPGKIAVKRVCVCVCDNQLEDWKVDYQNCCVQYCVSVVHVGSSYMCLLA